MGGNKRENKAMGGDRTRKDQATGSSKGCWKSANLLRIKGRMRWDMKGGGKECFSRGGRDGTPWGRRKDDEEVETDVPGKQVENRDTNPRTLDPGIWERGLDSGEGGRRTRIRPPTKNQQIEN